MMELTQNRPSVGTPGWDNFASALHAQKLHQSGHQISLQPLCSLRWQLSIMELSQHVQTALIDHRRPSCFAVAGVDWLWVQDARAEFAITD